MHKRKIAAQIFTTFGLDSLVRRSRSPDDEVVVLAYHRVLDFDPETYTGDIELISALPAEFQWQVNHVRDHYSPISMDQLVRFFVDGTPLPPRPVLFTFDDGFADNALIAAPILEAAQVPGHIFITTGYVGKACHFWFDWIVRAFCLTDKDIIELDGRDMRWDLRGASIEKRRHAATDLLRLIKKLPHEDSLKLRRDLEVITGVPQDSMANQWDRPMNWEQLADLLNKGISFGSHSDSHALLSQMTTEQVTNELARSKEQLRDHLGIDCRTFAYPVGGKEECTPTILAAVAAADYRVAFTYRHGIVPRSADNLLTLKRVRVEREITRKEFGSKPSVAIFLCFKNRQKNSWDRCARIATRPHIDSS